MVTYEQWLKITLQDKQDILNEMGKKPNDFFTLATMLEQVEMELRNPKLNYYFFNLAQERRLQKTKVSK